MFLGSTSTLSWLNDFAPLRDEMVHDKQVERLSFVKGESRQVHGTQEASA